MSFAYDFNLTHTPSLPTFVLCNKGQEKLGCINIVSDFQPTFSLKTADEFSLTVHKYADVNICNLWNKIKDLRLIYIPEYDEYYEISVTVNQNDITTKTILGTSLCESELSQLYLNNIEINTESDILREDYEEPTIIYNKQKPKISLLNRIFSKAPHYSIKHVDESIAKLQRSFSINGESIYDFLTTTLSEEINCLVLFDSHDRSISVYDMYSHCTECDYRGEFENTCPKCNSHKIVKGYGEDTSIFISRDNLLSDVSWSCKKDEIKNSFKLSAGDDLMTATVAACNPIGTPYIYYFSDDFKENMSLEFKNKLDEYNKLFDSKTPEYQKIMEQVYDYIDKIAYATSEKMPKQEIVETTAEKEVAKLTAETIGNIAVADLTKASSSTVNSTVLSVAKIFVFRGYKTTVFSSTYNKETHIWSGKFQVKSHIDDEDIAISKEDIVLTVNDDYVKFIEQKLEKSLSSSEETSTVLNPKLTLDELKIELKKYCLNRLLSFESAYQSCIDILIQLGLGDESHELYNNFYLVWYNKLLAIQNEIKLVEIEIKGYEEVLDTLEKQRDEIHDLLDIKTFFGDKLWVEYCSHIREGSYSNDNYISDGLKNSELFKNAKEFLETAYKELKKASIFHYSLTGTINNLLSLEEFEPLHNSFKLGNWIRVSIDEQIVKLRLTSFSPSYDDFSQMTVEFADETKILSSIQSSAKILKTASKIASRYTSVERTSKKGKESYDTINNWKENGIDTSATKIVNDTHPTLVYNEHGLLCRYYDPILEEYNPSQLRFIGDVIAYTDDNWRTSKMLISNVDVDGVQKYGVSADVITDGAKINGAEINSSSIDNGNFRLYKNGRMESSDIHITGGSININDKFIVNENGNSNIDVSESEILFSESQLKENINSGETLSILFGKMKKWLSSLKSAAFKDVKNDLETTTDGYVLDARVGKTISNRFKEVENNLENKVSGKLLEINFIAGNSTDMNYTYDIDDISFSRENCITLSILVKDSSSQWIDAVSTNMIKSDYPSNYRIISNEACEKPVRIILLKYKD